MERKHFWMIWVITGLIGLMIIGIPWPATQAKLQAQKPKNVAKEIIITAEDAKILGFYNQQKQIAAMQLAAAQQANDAANARFDGYTEKLGRLYNFDPLNKSYSPQPDGTMKVEERKDQ